MRRGREEREGTGRRGRMRSGRGEDRGREDESTGYKLTVATLGGEPVFHSRHIIGWVISIGECTIVILTLLLYTVTYSQTPS